VGQKSKLLILSEYRIAGYCNCTNVQLELRRLELDLRGTARRSGQTLWRLNDYRSNALDTQLGCLLSATSQECHRGVTEFILSRLKKQLDIISCARCRQSS